MELSRISSTPYRPRVIRRSQRDLRLVRRDKSLEPQTRVIMKSSPMLLASSRRRIAPINQRDLGSIHRATRMDSGTVQVSLSIDIKPVH
jgi:hypothetical protein